MSFPDYSLRWHNRLHSGSQFQNVFSNNIVRSSSHYFLVLAANNNLSHARLGLVIGKKKLAKAHQRNRVKRIIRDSFRTNKQILSGLDIVIVSRNGLETAHSEILRDDLIKHWSRLLEGQQ